MAPLGALQGVRVDMLDRSIIDTFEKAYPLVGNKVTGKGLREPGSWNTRKGKCADSSGRQVCRQGKRAGLPTDYPSLGRSKEDLEGLLKERLQRHQLVPEMSRLHKVLTGGHGDNIGPLLDSYARFRRVSPEIAVNLPACIRALGTAWHTGVVRPSPVSACNV